METRFGSRHLVARFILALVCMNSFLPRVQTTVDFNQTLSIVPLCSCGLKCFDNLALFLLRINAKYLINHNLWMFKINCSHIHVNISRAQSSLSICTVQLSIIQFMFIDVFFHFRSFKRLSQVRFEYLYDKPPWLFFFLSQIKNTCYFELWALLNFRFILALYYTTKSITRSLEKIVNRDAIARIINT